MGGTSWTDGTIEMFCVVVVSHNVGIERTKKKTKKAIIIVVLLSPTVIKKKKYCISQPVTFYNDTRQSNIPTINKT